MKDRDPSVRRRVRFRWLFVVLALLIDPGHQTVHGQERLEPVYAPRARWSEDWSGLKDFAPLVENDAQRTGEQSSYKFIPLSESGGTYLSLGAEARLAYEFYDDADMGISVTGNQDALQFRGALHADLHFGDEWRAFGEFGIGLATDREGGNKTADRTRVAPRIPQNMRNSVQRSPRRYPRLSSGPV